MGLITGRYKGKKIMFVAGPSPMALTSILDEKMVWILKRLAIENGAEYLGISVTEDYGKDCIERYLKKLKEIAKRNKIYLIKIPDRGKPEAIVEGEKI